MGGINMKQLALFFGILWRESPAGGRVSLMTAWKVSMVLRGTERR